MQRILVLLPFFLLLNVASAVEPPVRSPYAVEAVKACNGFALKLFNQMGGEEFDGNLFISPFSISQATGMLLDGARGKTLTQIRATLSIPENLSNAAYQIGTRAIARSLNEKDDDPVTLALRAKVTKLEAELAALREKAKQGGAEWSDIEAQEGKIVRRLNMYYPLLDNNKFTLANSIWCEKTYPFSNAYLRAVQKYYGTGNTYYADFTNRSDDQRVAINGWVERHTEGKIQNILPPGSVTKMTRIALANAVYFKGEWLKPFNEHRTKKAPFTLKDGSKTEAATMKQTLKVGQYAGYNADGSFFTTPQKKYVMYDDAKERAENNTKAPGETRTAAELLKEAQDLVAKMEARPKYPAKDGFVAMSIPYRGEKLEMILLIPQSHEGCNALRKKLTPQLFANCRGNLKSRDVHLELAKFKLTQSFPLKGVLSTLGMPEAFDVSKADFSGMRKDGKRDLYLGSAYHKAFVEVNEKGTEAAAATIFDHRTGSAAPRHQFRVLPLYYTVPFVPDCKTSREFLFFICEKQYGTILFAGKVGNPN